MKISAKNKKGEGYQIPASRSKSNRCPSHKCIHAQLGKRVKPYPSEIMALNSDDVLEFRNIVLERVKNCNNSYFEAFESVKKDCIFYFGSCRFGSYDSFKTVTNRTLRNREMKG